MQTNTQLGQSLKLSETTKKVIGVIAIAASLSACTTVSHTPLSQDVSAHLAGKSVVLTKYSTPNFAALTPGTAAFGVLGALVMIAQSDEIVKTNCLEDPSLKISQELAEKLSVERGITLVPNQNIISTSDDVEKLLSTYPRTDFLLDVKTFSWSFHYYPSDWTHYRVSYSARLRLVDSATKKVVAEALCKTTQGDDKNPPSKDQLLNNKASLLKAYLAKAASGCVNVFSANILNLSASQNAVGSGAALPTVASLPSRATNDARNVPGQLNGNSPPASLPPVRAELSSPMVPALIASPPELSTGQIGQYSYETEHLPQAKSCSTAPHAILSAKGPGFESYTVSCDNGDALAMRCDFGQCRVLR